MKKKALIFGISGQDGSLMAKFLVNKKYKVIGISRSNKNLKNLKKLKVINKIKVIKLNIFDRKKVENLIKKNKFNEIYFFAGQPIPSISNDLRIDTLYSNIIPVFNILNTLLKYKLSAKFFNASSCEIFGNNNNKNSENSKKNPETIYALSKLISLELVKFYRQKFKIRACSAILYQHESIFRDKKFVIKKIVSGVKKIKSSNLTKIKLGNISVKKDWGWAPEYVDIIFKILNSNQLDDYIICTGKTNSLISILNYAFKKKKLNWKKHVLVKKKLFRKNDIKVSKGNNNKLYNNLKLRPKNDVFKVVDKLFESIQD